MFYVIIRNVGTKFSKEYSQRLFLFWNISTDLKKKKKENTLTKTVSYLELHITLIILDLYDHHDHHEWMNEWMNATTTTTANNNNTPRGRTTLKTTLFQGGVTRGWIKVKVCCLKVVCPRVSMLCA